MLEDKQLKKLNEAWAGMSDVAAPTNEAAPTSEMPALLEELKNLITLKDEEIEVEINIGWHYFATIYEENGKWFPSISNRQISTMGYTSKEDAMRAIIKYFKDDK